jgi:hypothetical protein
LTDLTNPPFTRKPGAPPLHLRDLSPEELEQWRRMRAYQESKRIGALPQQENEDGRNSN